jgi:hypothetical protein
MRPQLPSKYQLNDIVTFTAEKYDKGYEKSTEYETEGMIIAVKFNLTTEVYDILNYNTSDIEYRIALDKIK